MLILDSVDKKFDTARGSLRILDGVSLTLAPGDSAAIMGPSGTGKSTLLNIIGTLEAPSGGSVQIAGQNPFTLDDVALAAFRNKTIGFVFQDHHLLPQLCVLENVLMPTLAFRQEVDHHPRAMELLERVGLADRLDHRPAELSGGERQRVAIARSLINNPKLILADEPTGNLDRETADSISDLLLQVYQDADAVLIAVTHSKELADRFGSLWQLQNGHLTRDK